MNLNRKALSPVVASIILIAVTVAVSIAVAAWMGALVMESGIMDEREVTSGYEIHYNGLIKNYYFGVGKANPETANLTLVQGLEYPKTMPYIQFHNGTEFMLETFKRNIHYVLTDYTGDYDHPPAEEMEPNYEYIVGNYSLWFYQDLDGVGKTAFVHFQTVTAWKEET